MKILNSKIEDINKILELYKIATDFQKTKSVVPWPNFDLELIEKEINENRQWKIVIDDEIACVWAITESDIQIWQEKMKNLLFIFIGFLQTQILEVGIW
ncbi:hypothetical protein [Polaribacter filamentus]|uniref:hypothetical protein n=1 Tax=Polaribacter filamentus TaxID=53483 RepID=UPI0026C28AAC